MVGLGRGTHFFSVPSAYSALAVTAMELQQINMHQLLEEEGVLLINYNLLLAEGIDCHICMKLLLFQIPCPIHCRDGKRREVNPILLW